MELKYCFIATIYYKNIFFHKFTYSVYNRSKQTQATH